MFAAAMFEPLCIFILGFSDPESTNVMGGVALLESAAELFSQLMRSNFVGPILYRLSAEASSAEADTDRWTPSTFALVSIFKDCLSRVSVSGFREHIVVAYKRLQRALASSAAKGFPSWVAELLVHSVPVRLYPSHC